jgi:hypothetical protein
MVIFKFQIMVMLERQVKVMVMLDYQVMSDFLLMVISEQHIMVDLMAELLTKELFEYLISLMVVLLEELMVGPYFLL